MFLVIAWVFENYLSFWGVNLGNARERLNTALLNKLSSKLFKSIVVLGLENTTSKEKDSQTGYI